MKKLIAVLIAAVALTGCASSLTGNYHEVDCIGGFIVKTFPVNGLHKVNLDAVRENRFGQKQYRVATNQDTVTFVYRWQNENNFEYVECR